MIKFVISAERFADACSVPDYLGVLMGRMGNQMNVLPRMVVAVGEHKIIKKATAKGAVDEVLKVVQDGEYIVEIVVNDDGDIVETKYLDEANRMMDEAGITPRRFTKLREQLSEAAKNIVNPPSGKDSNKL